MIGQLLVPQRRTAVKQGFIPDSLSTDLHLGNVNVLSMTELMSKFLAMGVPLEDLIRMQRSTRREKFAARNWARYQSDRKRMSLCSNCSTANSVTSTTDMPDGWKSKSSCPNDPPGGRILYDPSGLSMVQWEKAPRQYFVTPELGSSPAARADNYPR